MHPILGHPGRLPLYLAVWLPLAGLLALLLGPAAGGDWVVSGSLALALAIAFAFFALALWFPTRVTPLRGSGVPRLVATHLVGAPLASMLWLLAGSGLAALAEGRAQLAGSAALFAERQRLLFAVGLLLYLLVVAAYYLVAAFEGRAASEARALQLKGLAAEAELRALKAQVDPHFLFNSLNSVSALCVPQPERAREMTIELARFLRRSLAAAARETVTLAEELALVRGYLAVEGVRFGPRLKVREEIEDAALDCPVPPLLLQPLVENAVRHGIAECLDGGELRLQAAVEGEYLRILIENPVEGAPPARARRGGIGLENVHRRLQVTYGPKARLDTEAVEGRFRVMVDLPAAGAGDES